jgi:NAD(P)-dependent dehydrogenase (short-subunit alcohol dehydrogenase family)
MAEGSDVTIVGKDPGRLSAAEGRLRAEHGRPVNAVAVDMSLPDALDRISAQLMSVDVLVNNAGAIPGGGLDRIDDETWRRSWDLKVFGYVNAARLALPAMVARGSGVIVNVIGIAGVEPRYDYICGSVANAGLVAFTKAAGGYSARHGVRVVGINPGPTETDRVTDLYRARAEQRFGDPERWRELFAQLPFGRLASADEMADLAVFLASQRASYISGVVVDADGGSRHA